MISLVPARQEGEGSPQYMARLALANGYSGAAEFAADFGLDVYSVANGRDIEAFVRAVGHLGQGISRDTGVTDGKHVRVFGQTLRRKQWSTQGPPSICPRCWSEDLQGSRVHQRLPRNWHRTVWDVRPLTVCLRHGMLLVSSCSCGVALSRRDWLANRCGCGLSHSGLSTEAVPESGYAGDGYVAARLSGKRDQGHPLDAFELGDAIAAMETLGQAWAASRGRDSSLSHEILSAGLHAWTDWPARFREILSGLRDRNMADGTWGAANAYGKSYEDFRRMQPPELRRTVAAAVARHAADMGIARSSKPTLGVRASGRKEMSLAALAKEIGCGTERTRRLAGQAGVTLERVRSGYPARVPSDLLRLLRDQLAASIDAATLGKRLGVGKAVVRALCAQGLLRPQAPASTSAARAFRADEADSFRERLVRGRGNACMADPVTLKEVSRRLNVAISSVCRKLADGEIVKVRVTGGPTVVQQVLVDLDEVTAAFRAPPLPGMTVSQVAAALGVKWQVASELSKAGFIGPLRLGLHAAPDVRRFAAANVKNADLAREMEILPRRLLGIAAEHSIAPVIAPPACRQAFFSVVAAQELRAVAGYGEKVRDSCRSGRASVNHSASSGARSGFGERKPGEMVRLICNRGQALVNGGPSPTRRSDFRDLKRGGKA